MMTRIMSGCVGEGKVGTFSILPKWSRTFFRGHESP